MDRVIHTFPRLDDEFRRLVLELAQKSETPRALQAALRTTHPDAVVNNGVTDNQGRKVWYAYRNGTWAKTIR